MDLEQKLNLITYGKLLAGAIGLIIGTLLVLWLTKLETKYKKEKETADKVAKEQKEIADKIAQNPEEYVHDGGGFYLILEVGEVNEPRRKFIVDFGTNPERNRVSLYSDIDNNLVYRILDAEGEAHSVKVPPNFHSFKKGARYFIYCDYGYSKKFSFMRMFIDDRQVGMSSSNNLINFPHKIDPNTGIIGTDMEKKYFGKFTIGFWAVMAAPLPKNKIDKLREITINLDQAL